jgi:hypothetical protein
MTLEMKRKKVFGRKKLQPIKAHAFFSEKQKRAFFVGFPSKAKENDSETNFPSFSVISHYNIFSGILA